MACSSQLSREEVARYSRQLILPEWGARGELQGQWTICFLLSASPPPSLRPGRTQVLLCADSRCGWAGLPLRPLLGGRRHR